MTCDAETCSGLETSYRQFVKLLELAEGQWALGNAQAAVALAQVAARLAYPANVGLFASPRLERLLTEVGRSLAPSRSPAPIPAKGGTRDTAVRRVLHVLSYARPVGGDTRFVWRWIQEDRHNIHSVVVTTQAELSPEQSIPEPLQAAVAQAHGTVRVLHSPPTQPLAQAEELRQLCLAADLVVLHLFPYDVVPVIALAGCSGHPKALYINHSDHTFWIGASVSHAVVHVRAQQSAFLARRRHLLPRIQCTLPIPLAYTEPAMNRAQAKAALGYPADTILLLSIASPFKYSAPGRVGLLEMVLPAVLTLPNVVFMAVGPEDSGPWHAASEATSGRVVALGSRHDNELRYCAADIYLDSAPFSSVTSILEAGVHGAALLGYLPPTDDLQLLGPGAPGLDGVIELAESAESYGRLLRRLILDTTYRQQQGLHAQERILSKHTGSGWSDALSSLYGAMEDLPNSYCLAEAHDSFEASELNGALVHLYQKVQGNNALAQLVRHYLRPMSLLVRVRLVWRLFRKGLGFHYSNLAPHATIAVIRPLVAWIRQLRLRQSAHLASRGKSTPRHV